MRAPTARTKTHAVVYTAIFGGHDTLKEPVPQDESCEFICFTDTRIRPASGRGTSFTSDVIQHFIRACRPSGSSC
jgi:hypothetical protein